MKRQENSNDWKIVIPSKLENIELVIERIKLAAQKIGLNSSRFTELQLTLHEAISNAVKHGNKFDKDKKVKVEWKQKGCALRIIVKDEGDGFKPDDLPNPLAPENLMKENGRGICFIRRLAKEVQFNKKGNRLTFLFTK